MSVHGSGRQQADARHTRLAVYRQQTRVARLTALTRLSRRVSAPVQWKLRNWSFSHVHCYATDRLDDLHASAASLRAAASTWQRWDTRTRGRTAPGTAGCPHELESRPGCSRAHRETRPYVLTRTPPQTQPLWYVCLQLALRLGCESLTSRRCVDSPPRFSRAIEALPVSGGGCPWSIVTHALQPGARAFRPPPQPKCHSLDERHSSVAHPEHHPSTTVGALWRPPHPDCG